MRHILFRGLLAFSALICITACGKLGEDTSKYAAYYSYYPYPSDPLEKAGIVNAMNKCRQVVDISWSPVADLQGNTRVFQEGKIYQGIPYSSVKECEKFVPLNVSFRTFMTALRNPRSVLYTENVSKPPYKGLNCSLYYGTVCSTTIAYILGWDLPYTTAIMNGGLPFLESVSEDDIRPLDIILYAGHVILVDEVFLHPNSGAVALIRILQSAGSDTYTGLYTPRELHRFISSHKASLYRYSCFENNQDYSEIPYLGGGGIAESQLYNDVLCPDRGDAACYRTDEPVKMNLLKPGGFDHLVLVCPDGTRREYAINATDMLLSGLSPGTYEVFLSGKDIVSKPASFCVVDTDVSVKLNGVQVIIQFHSDNAVPVGIIFSHTDTRRIAMYALTDEQKEAGMAIVPSPTGVPDYYCKVLFKNEFGSITNDPIYVLR